MVLFVLVVCSLILIMGRRVRSSRSSFPPVAQSVTGLHECNVEGTIIMAYMTLAVELPDSGYYVEFTGPKCEVWPLAGGNTIYSGPIEDMPADALAEALQLEYIKQR
jgi:hypothetical protein